MPNINKDLLYATVGLFLLEEWGMGNGQGGKWEIDWGSLSSILYFPFSIFHFPFSIFYFLHSLFLHSQRKNRRSIHFDKSDAQLTLKGMTDAYNIEMDKTARITLDRFVSRKTDMSATDVYVAARR